MIWPDGNAKTLQNAPVDQLLTIEYGQAKLLPARPKPFRSALLTDVTDTLGVRGSCHKSGTVVHASLQLILTKTET